MLRNAIRAVRNRRFSTNAEVDIDKLPKGDSKLIGPTWRHWFYEKAGHNQYGLMHDDILHENDVVKEALRRLYFVSPNIVDERNFRIVRAGYVSARNTVLPKEQWLKLEDEVYYLQPYIDEVKAEIAEKKEWDSIDDD